MTQQSPTTTTSPSPTAVPRRGTLGLYLAGLIASVAGLAFTLLDQTVLGALDRHQHALYDPIGKTGAPTPLYVYLYAIGVLGVVCWLVCLRLVRRQSPSARKWSIAILVLALLVVAPLFLQEYGQLVIPLQLSAFPAAAWLLGLLGVLTLRSSRSRAGEPAS